MSPEQYIEVSLPENWKELTVENWRQGAIHALRASDTHSYVARGHDNSAFYEEAIRTMTRDLQSVASVDDLLLQFVQEEHGDETHPGIRRRRVADNPYDHAARIMDEAALRHRHASAFTDKSIYNRGLQSADPDDQEIARRAYFRMRETAAIIRMAGYYRRYEQLTQPDVAPAGSKFVFDPNFDHLHRNR